MRIHRLTLATADLNAQARFWGETLGLPTKSDGDRAVEVSLRESAIRLEQAAPGFDARYRLDDEPSQLAKSRGICLLIQGTVRIGGSVGLGPSPAWLSPCRV
jgi:hypothetical protein